MSIDAPSRSAILPDPDQPSSHGSSDPSADRSRSVIIWDGECNFCRQQVLRLRKLDWSDRLTFLSLHDPRVAQRYPQLTHEQLMAEMWVVTPDGQKFGGADALRQLSRTLPALWPIAPLLHIPLTMPVWRALYRWIARNRYRLAGKNCNSGTCDLHAARR